MYNVPYKFPKNNKLVLFQGGFAKCYEIVETKSKESFAGKIISKKHIIKNNHKDKISQEICIHKMLKNKNIVSLHSVFEDDNFVYIVLELCQKRSMMELHK
jgi:polo-like kinase 1